MINPDKFSGLLVRLRDLMSHNYGVIDILITLKEFNDFVQRNLGDFRAFIDSI